ncbi:hypothetical protein B0A50_07030 [Salinomyces thailandicus]|uniref:Thioesterase domain-containing protein n=1 Tax=Salinomyces thailandicus TaxID=706561 RepID=A0A4V5N3L7_9PEZI|nr:hypothetical protein B0A50_07030 [Salinomyces thailandica]
MSNSHPTLQVPWCQKLLSSPSLQGVSEFASRFQPGDERSNNIFQQTLYNGKAVLAHVSFTRPCQEPDATTGIEECNLISLGTGVDGKNGRAHGGFNALILDQLTGGCAYSSAGPNPIPPATAWLNVEYKAPIDTPGVVLARAWVTGMERRKIWVSGVIEDGEGKVLATARSLYVTARTGPKL